MRQYVKSPLCRLVFGTPLVFLLWSISASPAKALSCQDYRDIGDVLRYALPAAAYGMTALNRDGQGAVMYTKTLVMTGAATGFFKTVGGKHRPDAGTSEQSFVSGHASAAVSGAAFIYTRYGKAWGIPAYLLAGLTVYSRYCSDKHFDDDLLGGSMVAMMANWYATSPYDSGARLYPSFTSNGLMMTWSTMLDGNRHPINPDNFDPRYRFLFEFGPLQTSRNVVQAPMGGGTIFDLSALEQNTAPTARLRFEYFPENQPWSDWSIYYSPLGITEFATPEKSIDFGDQLFDPGEFPEFNTNYRWFDLRARWRTAFFANENWILRAGVGLQYSWTKVEVEQGERFAVVKQEEVAAERLAPVLHLGIDYRFDERWRLEAELDGFSEFWEGDDKEFQWAAGLFLNYQPTLLWDLGVGIRLIRGRIHDPKLFNDFRGEELIFRLGRSF